MNLLWSMWMQLSLSRIEVEHKKINLNWCEGCLSSLAAAWPCLFPPMALEVRRTTDSCGLKHKHAHLRWVTDPQLRRLGFWSLFSLFVQNRNHKGLDHSFQLLRMSFSAATSHSCSPDNEWAVEFETGLLSFGSGVISHCAWLHRPPQSTKRALFRTSIGSSPTQPRPEQATTPGAPTHSLPCSMGLVKVTCRPALCHGSTHWNLLCLCLQCSHSNRNVIFPQ